MFGLGILEVAIGLIFIFSLLSIITTTINTLLAHIFKTRARHLKRGLEDLITDPSVRETFLKHPLISLMKMEASKPSRWEFLLRLLPSFIRERMNPQAAVVSAQAVAEETAAITRTDWIDKDIFSKVMTSILAEKAALTVYLPLTQFVESQLEGAEQRGMQILVEQLQVGGVTLNEFQQSVNRLADPSDRTALTQALEQVNARQQSMSVNDYEGSRLIPLLEGVRQIDEQGFKRALKTLVGAARSVEEAQAELEGWFDQRMAQLTELYKRHLMMFSLLIGLVLSIILNADTLQIARTLFDDPTLRAAVVAAAAEAVESGALEQNITTPTPAPSATPVLVPTVEGGLAPTVEVLPPVSSQAVTPEADEETPADRETAELVERAGTVLSQLLQLNLPILWENTAIAAGCVPSDGQAAPLVCENTRNLWLFSPGNNPNWFSFWVRKLIGVALTMLAVAQGAPFWFDLLNRLVGGRGGSSADK